MKHKTKSSNKIIARIVSLFILLVLLLIVLFLKPRVDAPGPPSDLHINEISYSTYQHPDLLYSISYPSSWKREIFQSPAGMTVQPYSDVVLFSPNYKDNGNRGFNVSSGSFIFVRGLDTTYTSIEEKFKNNRIAQAIAKNITKVTVDNLPAIQYSYDEEGDLAVNTVFIKNKIWYLFKLESATISDQAANWETYQKLIQSFSGGK